MKKNWLKKFKNKWLKMLLFVILIIVMAYNYKNNYFGTIETINFGAFQGDSELLVYNKIYNDKYNIGKSKYGLLINNGVPNVRELLVNNEKNEDIEFTNYQSQIGLQGFISSFAHLKLHMSLDTLQYICCFLTAIVLVAISYQIYKKYSKLLGIIFMITFVFSHWIINFSRNLYWLEFIWFLPGLLGLLLSKDYSKKKIYVPLIFLTILFKCLCGYEYITCIMLFTISFFVIDFFRTKDKDEKKKIFKTTFIVGISCLLAFFTALTIHSYFRGNGNLKDGLVSIYKEDVARRTLNIPGSNAFDETIFGESINATIRQTIEKYLVWETEIIFGIHGTSFKILILTAILSLIYSFYKKYKDSKNDLIMFIMFALITLSWFVLAKAHTYIHVNMNYVLWYFGFVQMILYLTIKLVLRLFSDCIKSDKLLENKRG